MMMHIKDKKQLEIKLSSLESIKNKNIKLEQYQSSAELAALILWKAYMNGDIFAKAIADLGCGNGVLGIGALLLGASKAYFVDVDESALEVCRKNVDSLGFLDKAVFVNSDVSSFDFKVDTVIMNPPFGVKLRKADKAFLETGFRCAKAVYSLHKIESSGFISKITAENGFSVISVEPVDMKVLKSYFFHRKESVNVKIGMWMIRKGITPILKKK